MSFKSKIKNVFIGKLLISEYHSIMSNIMPRIYDDETAVKKHFKKHFGKELNLDNPTTFAEKICWYKLNSHDPLMAQCADKAAVREFITEKGYEDSLNEVFGVYNSPDEIDLKTLPDQFVIKATHGSHMGFIVKDKDNFDWKHAKILLKSWLHQDIYWGGREWVYKDIPKRIIVEEYLEDDNGELRDYKFFCFNGKPEYMEYDIGRFGGKPRRNFYDMEMNLMEFVDVDCEPDLQIKEFPLRKDVYLEMQKMAGVLSEPFQQARIDFYYCNNKIYFGEITFFDGGGTTVFSPDEWNYKFSENWIIK